MSSFTWLISFISYTFADNCKWGAFTLEELKNVGPISCVAKWQLEYTPCANGNSICNDEHPEQGDAMIIQIGSNSCIYLAKWDDGFIDPDENIEHGVKQYTFHYTNGLGGRNITINFMCDPNAIPYDEDSVSCDEPSGYNYELTIVTYLACKNMFPEIIPLSNLSIGSFFLILFVAILFVYCIVGYIVKWKIKSNSFGNCRDNVPHYTFWKMLPRMIKTGCIVSCEWIMGTIGKGRNNHETDVLMGDE
eukprot:359438_1